MTDSVEKKLLPGEVRFVPRFKRTGPRSMVWEVYDRATGSIPCHRPEVGQIKQDMKTEAEALTECERISDLVRGR